MCVCVCVEGVRRGERGRRRQGRRRPRGKKGKAGGEGKKNAWSERAGEGGGRLPPPSRLLPHPTPAGGRPGRPPNRREGIVGRPVKVLGGVRRAERGEAGRLGRGGARAHTHRPRLWQRRGPRKSGSLFTPRPDTPAACTAARAGGRAPHRPHQVVDHPFQVWGWVRRAGEGGAAQDAAGPGPASIGGERPKKQEPGRPHGPLFLFRRPRPPTPRARPPPRPCSQPPRRLTRPAVWPHRTSVSWPGVGARGTGGEGGAQANQAFVLALSRPSLSPLPGARPLGLEKREPGRRDGGVVGHRLWRWCWPRGLERARASRRRGGAGARGPRKKKE